MKRIMDRLRNGLFDILNPNIARIKKKRLTYLSKGALRNILRCVKHVETANTAGIFVETGCALGGSTIAIALAKRRRRILKVYDVFAMIPPPSVNDEIDVHNRYNVIKNGKSKGIDGDLYYGYEENLLDKVRQNLQAFGLTPDDNIELIQGLYEQTLHINEAIAFAHIDCDWYASTLTCLNRIEPNLSLNGIVIIDDFGAWSGCKRAVQEYFKENDKTRQYDLFASNGRLILQRIAVAN